MPYMHTHWPLTVVHVPPFKHVTEPQLFDGWFEI